MESSQNSNSSKLILLVLLHARTKKIHLNIKAIEWSQHVFHYKSIEIFYRRSRAGNSVVPGRILQNFEPIGDLIVVLVVLVTCKNKDEPIKNGGVRVVTIFSPL